MGLTSWNPRRVTTLAIGLTLLAGCRRGDEPDDEAASDGSSGGDEAHASSDGSGEDGGTDAPIDDPAPEADLVGVNGLRRLTVHEYDNVVADLLGDDTRPARAFLPEDVKAPFDNDATDQVPSSALIDGAEALALDIAGRLIADTSRRMDIVGCEPTGADDLGCLGPFVDHLGRLALRRPLVDAERDQLLALRSAGSSATNAWIAVETIVAALLQHPEFLYRTEIGVEREDQPGTFRLSPYEEVSRLSFFLLGTSPDDGLLDAAQEVAAESRSFTTDERRSLAEALLATSKAREQIDRFHALWLNYESLPHEPELAEPMRAETRALIDEIIFDSDRPWTELLTADETWLTGPLATHYGLPAPADASGGWVSYGDGGRAGLLSHGSFLANGGAFGDTSPILRGLVVKTRLLCQEIPEPPPDVNVDDEPTSESPCKWERFAPHRDPECASCHAQFDPYGWGLENYDAQGRFRTEDDAGCDLTPHTEVESDFGVFRGPGELGGLLAETQTLRNCITTQLYRFALGRGDLETEDLAFIGMLSESSATDFTLQDMLLTFVADQAFGHRKEESQ